MKKTITISLLILLGYNGQTQTSAGPLKPTVFANNTSTNTTAWTIPSFTATGMAGIVNPPVNSTSKGLNLTNFGFSIPNNATILGIEATTTYSYNNSANVSMFYKDTIVRLLKGGVEAGNNLGTIYSTTPSTCLPLFTYGSNTNLWGTSLTAADINSPNFGFVIYIKRLSNDNASLVLHSELNGGGVCSTKKTTLTVYYTISTGVIESQSSAPKQIYSSGKSLCIKELVAENATLEVYNLLGQKVHQLDLAKGTSFIPLDFLSGGTYLYKIKFAGKEICKKFFIE